MMLQDIYVYPIKSLGGISLKQAKAEERGLQYDRRWMLVDEHNMFLTQRTFHQMALLQVSLTPEGLRVYHKLHPNQSIHIPFEAQTNDKAIVSIWDDTVPGQRVSAECDEWFSDMLGKNCRLMLMPESSKRPVDKNYAVNNENVSFADGYPYLVISQASLDDLNRKLAKPVTMDRFRPSLVVSGTEPFGEDGWNEFAIGDARFKVVKPCARCVLTTVNQQTAIAGKEPLRTLAKYRTIDNKVLFGQNCVATQTGMLQVNEQITLL
jgi:uncharacterized protein